ncbi:ribonuclease pancreatic-like [Sceloporus undulatus]|uniref:ribonuclease pancreatic-like n=1 Tax=Sceloporus undulatus TaxID=8520 RepID=UPI001C4BB4C5|nr:ribonuclease pancreatic-like [Sceloporus undulatus]
MLTSKFSCCLVAHLAILLGLLLLGTCKGQNWSSFQTKHIDFPKSSASNPNAYCDLMMKRRNLNPTRCKPRNTFVHASQSEIQNVCSSKGTHYKDNLYDSEEDFPLTDCKNVGGTSPDNCKYIGTPGTKRIRVACENNKPVHFELVLATL